MPQPDQLSASVRHKETDVSFSATGKRALQTVVALAIIAVLALLLWLLVASPSKGGANVDPAVATDHAP